jgi:lipopolysaccharide transport system ATP-binding protein
MSSRSDIAVSVRGLSKSYTIAHEQERESTLAETLLRRARNPFKRPSRETFWALKDISFDIQKGDVVGIIGRNGAGKSTLLKILSRITEPTSGSIDLYGRVGSLLEVGTGFHPELTGRENIYLNGQILGMRIKEVDRQFDAIVDFSGCEKFLDTPVKRYSSGMYVRLAFAVAAHLESAILIVDEVLAVGDAEFQRKCLGKMKDVATGGRTVLFVSHHMQSVQVLCNSAMYLERGQVLHVGAIDTAIARYMATFGRNNAVQSDPDRRPGTGELRFTLVEPSKEYFSCAEEKVINYVITRRRPFVGKFFLSAHILNDVGVIVSQCDSRMIEVWLDAKDEQAGTFTIRLPWLKPGEYRIEMFICSAGIIDRWEAACRLEILPVLPYPAAGNDDAIKYGLVLADFTFS